jgi:hypothetical protein
MQKLKAFYYRLSAFAPFAPFCGKVPNPKSEILNLRSSA